MTIVNATRLFVGLDYHQDFVQVCILNETGKVVQNSKVDNDWRKITAAVPAGATVQAALEACCGAADLADELVEQANWSVSLSHPGFVARMKQNPDKTDYSDARLLADLTRVGYLPKVWLTPAELRELRRLVRYRQQKANERRDVKLRIRAILRDHRIKIDEARPWTKQWLAALAALKQIGPDTEWILQEHLTSLTRLKREIRDVERRLEERVANDAVVRKLREQKGIGLVTAAVMRSRDRPLRPVSDRQATGPLLRRDAAELLQRQQAGRCRRDPGGQSTTASRDRRSRASHHSLGRTVDEAGPAVESPRQTHLPGRGSRGQSLHAVVAPYDAAGGAGRIKMEECQGRGHQAQGPSSDTPTPLPLFPVPGFGESGNRRWGHWWR